MLKIPVSIGEIVDKITILEIKKSKIREKSKLNNIIKELNILRNILNKPSLSPLEQKLKKINLDLWNIEDKIRLKEKNKEFDKEFIELARLVYITNDKRAAIKKQINILTNSELVEEKSYEEY